MMLKLNETTKIQPGKSGFMQLLDTTQVDQVARRRPVTRVSRGGLDEINPEDIVYGEYAGGNEKDGQWIDVVYLENDILRTFSGPVSLHDPVVEELKVLLRSEDEFYVVPIREVPLGLAFKKIDIVSITTASAIEGNEVHLPSCVWMVRFKDDSKRTLEAEYQPYFSYGNTIRPASMTNASIVDKVFSISNKGQQ